METVPTPQSIIHISNVHTRVYQWLIILLFFPTLFTPAFSYQGALPYHLSTEEIDRPLVLPAHMWQVCVPVYFDFNFDPRLSYGYEGLITPIAPPFPRYSLSDKFEFVQFPWPYVRYALIQKEEIDGDTVRLKGLSLALEGGVQGAEDSRTSGFAVNSSFGIRMKSALGRRFWVQGVLFAYAENVRYVLFSLAPDVGAQLTDKIALTIGYKPTLEIRPAVLYKQSLSGYVYIDPNPYFALSAGLSTFNSGSYWQLEPSLAFWFQW